MVNLRRAVVAAALAGASLFTGAAHAANGYSITNLNLRAGPGLDHRVVATIPRESPVLIYGCLDAFDWCDVEWRQYRGWASSDFLSWYNGGRYYPVPEYGRRYGVPVVTFDFGYWDRYYADYPWYRDRPYYPRPRRHWDRYYGDDRAGFGFGFFWRSY